MPPNLPLLRIDTLQSPVGPLQTGRIVRNSLSGVGTKMQTAVCVLTLLASACSALDEPSPILIVNHKWEAVSVAFSPNGRILAAGSGHNGIILWDAKSGKELRHIDGPHVGDYVVFSPDGKTLASVRNWQQGESAGTVQLWDVATGKLRGQLKSDQNLIRCIAFSPNGKLLATHSQWGTDHVGAVRVWDLAARSELLKIPTNSAGHTIGVCVALRSIFEGDFVAWLGGTVWSYRLRHGIGSQAGLSNLLPDPA